MKYAIITAILAALSGALTALMRQYKIGPWNKEMPSFDHLTTVDYTPVIEAIKQPVQTFPHPMVMKWADAITHWEGANPTSHNGGNLKYTTLTASWGATKGHKASDGGYLCHFNTDAEGQKALYNFLTLGCEGQLIISHPKPCTLRQFTIRFAGNPPEGYIQGVCSMLGVSQGVDIATFLN